MKKTIGYGYKLNSESLKTALEYYPSNSFSSSIKEVKEEIKVDKKMNTISKNAKIQIFKVVIEV